MSVTFQWSCSQGHQPIGFNGAQVFRPQKPDCPLCQLMAPGVTEQQREAIERCDDEGLNTRQIMDALQLPINVVMRVLRDRAGYP